MFIRFVVARAAVVPIFNVKTTVIKNIVIVIIIYCVGGFLWIVNTPMLRLMCLLTYLLWVKFV